MKWDEKLIVDLCQTITDCVNKTAPRVDYETPFKMIRTTNIKDGRIDTNEVFYVEEDVFKIWTRRGKPELGDLILTREAPVGEVGIVRNGDQIFLGQRLIQYRADKSKIDHFFLYYQFRTKFVQDQLNSFAFGSTVAHIKVPDCKKIILRYPPLPIQQKIASILSAYDDLIENNLKRIRLLEEAAQHLYQEWFVRFRFPGWEEAEFGADGLPVGWERKTLGEICLEISSGGTPDRGNTNYWTSPEIQWVKTKELKDDFIFECEECISREGLEKSSAKLFPEGTILMAIYASPTLGRLGILTKEACFNQAMVGFRIDQNQTSSEFLYYKLLEERVNLNNMAIGAAQQNINVRKVKEFEVVLPSFDLIHVFSRIAQPFFSQRRALGAQNQKLKEARDILLPRLMDQTIVI